MGERICRVSVRVYVVCKCQRKGENLESVDSRSVRLGGASDNPVSCVSHLATSTLGPSSFFIAPSRHQLPPTVTCAELLINR